MATFSLEIRESIAAIIAGGDRIMFGGDTILLDPVTQSYTTTVGAVLNYFFLTIQSSDPTITYAKVLNNGVNSRFSAEGDGFVVIQLEVRDTAGGIAFTTITIDVI